MSRLPEVGADNNTWGTILNDYLLVSHDEGGALNANVVDTTQVVDEAITLDKLSTSVQTSLGKADSALQSAPVSSVAGKTGAVTLDTDDITDATAVGTDVLTAATQADARTAIGAGTSSFSGSYDDLTSKPTLGTAAAVDVIDEDNFATNSATRPPSQQSTKAYVDGAVDGLVASTDVNSIVKLTQEAYDALDPPVETTFYIIVSDEG